MGFQSSLRGLRALSLSLPPHPQPQSPLRRRRRWGRGPRPPLSLPTPTQSPLSPNTRGPLRPTAIHSWAQGTHGEACARRPPSRTGQHGSGALTHFLPRRGQRVWQDFKTTNAGWNMSLCANLRKEPPFPERKKSPLLALLQMKTANICASA